MGHPPVDGVSARWDTHPRSARWKCQMGHPPECQVPDGTPTRWVPDGTPTREMEVPDGTPTRVEVPDGECQMGHPDGVPDGTPTRDRKVPDGTPTRVPESARWDTHPYKKCQMGHPPESEGARGCQIGHPPESPGGSRASHAAREGVGSTRGRTGARGRACPWLGRTRGRRGLAPPRVWCAWSGEAAQAVARTQCASVVVGARWRFEATRASHDVGSCRRPGGARPFPTGASCRLPAAHSTWAR